MRNLKIKIIFFTLLLISTSMFASVAKVVALKGKASVVRDGSTLPLTRKTKILKQDIINTKSNTKIQLMFKDETIISIGKNSTFLVADYLYDEKNNQYKADFSMFKGTFRTITGKIGKIAPKKFNLKTKSASIGIRGTQIVMDLSPKIEHIFCTEGKIFVEKLDTGMKSIVNAGEFVSFEKDSNSFNIKKIKKSEIKEINNKVSIQRNLATDRISLITEASPINSNIEPPIQKNTELNGTSTTTQNDTPRLSISEVEKETEEVTVQQTAELAAQQAAEEQAAAELAAQQAAEEQAAAELAAQQAAEEQAAAELAAQQAAEEQAAAELAAQQAAEEQAAAELAAQQAAEEQAAAELAAQQAAEEQAAEELAAQQAAEEQAAAELAALQASEELRDSINFESLTNQTPETYFENNNSTVTYSGNFNSYEYDKDEQYIKKVFLPVTIPTETTISMDVDFGATDDQISNGVINVTNSYQGYYDTTFNFDGEISNTSNAEFKLNGTNETSGSGKGTFYGDEANTIRGQVDFENEDDIKIKAEFDANKEDFLDEDFITIEDITPESFFEEADSIATYTGDFNRYEYDSTNQYIKDVNGDKVEIPIATSISMDVDFGATEDHISNGEINISDVGDGSSEILNFDGEISDTSIAKFKLNGINGVTTGTGDGYFYGSEANLVVGDVNLKSATSDIDIKGTFEATKQ